MIETNGTALTVEAIDTSGWTELKEFFDKPESRAVLQECNIPIPGSSDYCAQDFVRLRLMCGFLSYVSVDKVKAIFALREDLQKLRVNDDVEIVSFLARPSTLPFVSPCLEGEVSDGEYCTDLSGPQPGKRRWAAFCFLHGYLKSSLRFPPDGCPPNIVPAVASLSEQVLRTLEIRGASLEGQIGYNLDLLQ